MKESRQMLRNYNDNNESKVLERAYQVCLEIYKTTISFPKDDGYGPASRIKKAAVSVAANISKGYQRKATDEYVQTLQVAYGCNRELETQVLLLGNLGYIEGESLKRIQGMIGEIEGMLKGVLAA
jgi:four helix bundle protein